MHTSAFAWSAPSVAPSRPGCFRMATWNCTKFVDKSISMLASRRSSRASCPKIARYWSVCSAWTSRSKPTKHSWRVTMSCRSHPIAHGILSSNFTWLVAMAVRTIAYLAVQHQRLLRIVKHVVFDVLQILFAPVKHLHRIIACMQMLQNFRDNLSLGTRIFFSHRPIHQFNDILEEMRDEIVQIFSVRLGVQALSANPFDSVSARKPTTSQKCIIRIGLRSYFCMFVDSILLGKRSSRKLDNSFADSVSKLRLMMSTNRDAFFRFCKLMLFM